MLTNGERRPVPRLLLAGPPIIFLAIAAAGVAADGPPPNVRFLEIGQQGLVSVGYPTIAHVEVTSEAEFHGTLSAQLTEPAAEGRGGRATLHLDLETGGRRALPLVLPPAFPTMEVGEAVIRWHLDDTRGEPLRRGVESARFAGFLPWRFPRELYLTRLALGQFHRPPHEAFDQLLPYAPFSACLIGGDDLVRLRPSQRQALLDHAATGAALVITAPVAAIEEALDGVLIRPDAVIWEDGKGHEAREAAFHLGFVRIVSLPLGELGPADPQTRSTLLRLLISRTPVRPVARRAADTGLDPFWFLEMPPASGPSVSATAALVSAASGAFVLLIGWLAWLAGRTQAASPGRRLILLLAGSALLPLPVYLVLSRVRSGNHDRCREVLYHVGHGPLQSRETVVSRGGGGGSREPHIALPEGPRAFWTGGRMGEGFETVELRQSRTGKLVLAPAHRGSTVSRLLLVRRLEIERADPDWEEEGLALRQGALVGRLHARRSFGRVALTGSGRLWRLGPVTTGQTLELAGVGTTPLSPPAWGEPPTGDTFDEFVRESGWGRFRHRPLPTYYAIAEEADASASRLGGERDESITTRLLHVQELSVEASFTADDLAEIQLPANEDGSTLRVQVPEVLWVEMQRRGLGLEPQTHVDTTRPAVAPARVVGFLELAFPKMGVPLGLQAAGYVHCRWITGSRGLR